MFGPKAAAFFKDLGYRLRTQSGDPLLYTYLVQQVAVAYSEVAQQQCLSLCGTPRELLIRTWFVFD